MESLSENNTDSEKFYSAICEIINNCLDSSKISVGSKHWVPSASNALQGEKEVCIYTCSLRRSQSLKMCLFQL